MDGVGSVVDVIPDRPRDYDDWSVPYCREGHSRACLPERVGRCWRTTPENDVYHGEGFVAGLAVGEKQQVSIERGLGQSVKVGSKMVGWKLWRP